MPDIFVGRQPIYNKDLGIFGYELLFRAGVDNQAMIGDITADSATSTTIINSFLEIGLEKLVGDQYAFINLTEGFLNEEEALPINPDQVIIEVLENVPVNYQLLKSIKRLSEVGFKIALDDYIYNPSHKPLVLMADIIKIDITKLTQKELINHVKILNKYKAKLLAEKIETIDEYEFCIQLGFEYFQGYFLSRPRIIKSKSLSNNKLAVLNLLSVLQNPDAEIDELESAISFDVAMSYKILKLINSAFFSFTSKVESIKQAIVILGRQQLRSWASMLAMSNLEDRPSEMIRIAMTRAKMCEFLAGASGLKPPETYFTVGLFSALDILMERSIEDAIEPLPLNDELTNALLHKQGVLGEALKCTLAYELSDFENVKFRNLDSNDIVKINVEALSWSNKVIESL